MNEIDRHVRHLVGIATLRRLRRMVDHEAAAEARASRRAKQLALLLAILAAIFIAALALDSARY